MEPQDDAPHTETEESMVGQNPEFRVVIRSDRDVPDISFSAVNHD
ncbi:MAG: hypothetical protein WCI42_01085 [Verrucomicrobiota bacterium]